MGMEESCVWMEVVVTGVCPLVTGHEGTAAHLTVTYSDGTVTMKDAPLGEAEQG